MSQYEKWLRCFWRWFLEAQDRGDKKAEKAISKTIQIMKERGY